MRIIGLLLLLCVLLSIARTVVIALLIALAITVLWGAFSRPRETFAALLCLAWLNIAFAYPGWMLLAGAGLAAGGIIKGSGRVQATSHGAFTKPGEPP